MLKTIIAREFLDNILNLRFMIGLVLCVIVTVACVVILSNDYKQELADYNQRVNRQDNILSNYANRNRLWGMIPPYKPPERFRPLIIGVPSENSESFDDNSLSVLFPTLDFLFIVTIVLSLLAVLFSYDAITGERQSGTLRLVVANSVSRVIILFGKLIGGTASLLIPFILSLLVGAFYISINPYIQWDVSAWLEFLLLTAASVTFIVLFYLLGLTVSTFSRNSSTSILTSLFIWILFILVIPNMCPYISAQICRIPSISETKRKTEEFDRLHFQMYSQRKNEIIRTYRNSYGKLFSDFESMECSIRGDTVTTKNPEAFEQRMAADSAFKTMVNALCEEIDQILNGPSFEDIKSKIKQLGEDLEIKAAAQTKLAKNLTCISPYANYLYLATDLTGTGLRSLRHFRRIRGQYMGQVDPYMAQKFDDAQKNDRTFTMNSFLDVDDRPRFIFQEESLRGKLNAALPYWGILALFNVVFFVAAFAGFMKYDVR